MKKKIISVILALTLCVGLAVPAMAAETMKHDFFGEDILEITNVVSVETDILNDPDVGNRTITTYYTLAPTTVTLLLEMSGGPESNIARITEDERSKNSISEWIYVPLTAGESGKAGSSFTLEEGTYYWMSTADFRGVYFVVSSSGTPAPAPEQPSSWAVDQVNAAIAANLVPASLQSKYTQATTRAEFCALAVALYENIKGEITGRSTFTDTSDINVQKAAAIGVVSGVGDNKFAPNDKLTREQAAVMLARLAKAVGKPLPIKAATFNDNAQISSWAVEQVGQIQAAGIMGGVGNNTFAPKDPYTREQSIITIMRLFDAVKSEKLPDGALGWAKARESISIGDINDGLFEGVLIEEGEIVHYNYNGQILRIYKDGQYWNTSESYFEILD